MEGSAGGSPIFSDHADPAVKDRGPLNLMALCALLLGLASPMAMLHRNLWCIPGLALLAGTIALLRIHRGETAASGRGMAIVGLLLGVAFTAAAPTYYFVRHARLVSQSKSVGLQWLEFLTTNEPYNALAMMDRPLNRPTLSPALDKYYRSDENARKQYEQFLNRPVIRALTTLGSRAIVRFYRNEDVYRSPDGGDEIVNIYAVTYLEGGQRRTFFVRLAFRRTDKLVKTVGFWEVLRYEGGVSP